jgi:hypothetical protein
MKQKFPFLPLSIWKLSLRNLLFTLSSNKEGGDAKPAKQPLPDLTSVDALVTPACFPDTCFLQVEVCGPPQLLIFLFLL